MNILHIQKRQRKTFLLCLFLLSFFASESLYVDWTVQHMDKSNKSLYNQSNQEVVQKGHLHIEQNKDNT